MSTLPPVNAEPEAVGVRLLAAAVLTGVAAGVAGVALTLLLHLVQHIAFGYTEASFLVGVERAAPERRVLALAIGGLVVGSLWWVLRRWGGAVRSVDDVLGQRSGRLPVPVTTADAVLQIVAVGAGASLGREGAPRQVGGALAGWLAARLDLPAGQRRTVLACGAGAGLAAVYNLPLAGAVFTLEVLLRAAAWRQVVPALLTSAVATLVAWPVLSNAPTYSVPPVPLGFGLVVFAVLLGPIAGLAGTGFLTVMTLGRRLAPPGRWLPVTMTVVFGCLGAAAIVLPELPGNGKGPAQSAFDGSLAAGTLVAILIAKPLVTAACLAAGARGGLLTPSLATGAVLGSLAGLGWAQLWPGLPPAGYAVVGAGALLATTMRAPLCAVVLVLELTHAGLDVVLPLTLAVAGSVVTAAGCERLIRSTSRAQPH